MAGVLALVGGNEWQEKCTFDRELLEASGGTEVLVLPTAAAYEHPQRSVETAQAWFQAMGATVRGLDVLRRQDAENEGNAAAIRAARFIYLSGGSPMHLRSVLKDSPVWDAITETMVTFSLGVPFGAPGTPSAAIFWTVSMPAVT